MYRRPDGWSFGPYWKYWNIDASESASYSATVQAVTERATTTEEFGFKALYQF